MSKLGMLDVGGAKYTLKQGETYLIGLKCNDYNQSHDIEIDDTSVDIKHCILDCNEKLAKLIDLRSKCGTFIGGMRVEACKMVALVKSTTIQFGNVEATIELVSESDSGYLEGRLNSPSKDTSEIISNSPEQVSSSGGRLKHNLKSSLASTSGATVTSNILIQSPIKTTPDFLVPTGVVRKSMASNTSARSVDSFYIPETQCLMDNNDKINNSANVSIDTNKTNQSILNPVGTDDEDDFFIPETQDIGSVQVGRLSNYPRLTFQNEEVNEGVVDVVKIPSSQFRICTQDFNGSCDDLSNCSEDMLSTVPCSIIIPPIRHDTVHIDDFLNGDDDELEIEKEMSSLQWSKKTDEPVDNSLTPDIIHPVDGLVTPDIIEGIEPSKDNSKESDTREDIQPTQVWKKSAIEGVELPVSACKQIEVFSKKTDEQEDIPPTQVWTKPASLNKSIAEVSYKENIIPQENDIFMVATQVFKAPLKAKSPSLVLPPSSLLTPPPSLLQPPVTDDDLPPTQVFEKVVDKQTNKICLSSTLLDHGMQLSESSFKRNCNKFLDSDDDEMSDTVAPEIMKNVEMPYALKTPPNQKNIPSPVSAVKLSNKKNNATFPSTKVRKPLPNDEFRVPQSVTKKKTRPEPAVSIDDFLLTPDFLRKGFCKDTHLQQQVEKNWKSIISEKQRTSLFGEEDSDGNPLVIDSDSSQDSFEDLLPVTVVKDVTKKTLDKVAKSKERESDDGRRVARRRKAKLEEETSEKKVPRKSTTQTNVESDKKLKNESLKAKTSEKYKKGETADKAVEKNNKLRDKIKNAEVSKKEGKNAEKHSPDENTKKISSGKQQKKLFGTEDSDRNPLTIDSTSKDSLDDLPPHKALKTNKALNKEVKPKAHEADDGMRITRRRKSKLEEEPKERNVSKKSSSETKLVLKKHPNKVKNDDRKKDEGNFEQVGENKVAMVSKVEAKLTESAAENHDVMSNKEDNKTKPGAEKKLHEKQPTERSHKKNSEDVLQKISNHPKDENRELSHNTSSSSSHNRSNKYKSMDKRQNRSNQKEPEEKSSVIVSDKQEMNTSKENTTSSKDNIKKVILKKNKEKSQEQKPVARVTRLRSAKTATVTEVEVIDKKKYTLRGKDNAETQGVKRSHEPKSIVNDSSNIVTYDLTTESPQPTTKRKNASYEPRNKRLKSTSSVDSVTSIPSSNESHRSIRIRPQKPKISMTMCEPKYQDLLERYSGTLWFITTDPKECDVMVVEKGNRTYKIMIAIARGIPIVKLDWFKEVVKTKSVQVPYEKYIFDDTNFQERHQFDMKKTLNLAKERSLFNGIGFLMTPGIRPVPNEMKDIIVCSGGTVHDQIPKPKEGQQIYLVSSPTDNQYWHKYRRTNSNIKIVTSDGVMASVMQQSETPLKKSIIQ